MKERFPETVNGFLQKYRRVEFEMNVTRPRIKCADGYTVSAQAGYGIYSVPRIDADFYNAVELGYPSAEDKELIPYAENRNSPLNTVYGYVPVKIVDEVLKKHGGIIGADFSNVASKDWPRTD